MNNKYFLFLFKLSTSLLTLNNNFCSDNVISPTTNIIISDFHIINFWMKYSVSNLSLEYFSNSIFFFSSDSSSLLSFFFEFLLSFFLLFTGVSSVSSLSSVSPFLLFLFSSFKFSSLLSSVFESDFSFSVLFLFFYKSSSEKKLSSLK